MDLVGNAEIAEMLGVSKQRASQLANEPTFPKPANDRPMKQGRVWKRQTIQRWLERRDNERNA